MQITFESRTADLIDATMIFAMILPALVKGCRAQGDTLAEIEIGISELVTETWKKLEAAEKAEMP